MNRKAEVYYTSVLAGLLEKAPSGIFNFRYAERHLADPSLPAISLSLQKVNPSTRRRTSPPSLACCPREKISKRNADYYRLMKTTISAYLSKLQGQRLLVQ